MFLLESMNCSQLGSSLGKLKMLPNGSGCRCHYIRHHLDWHWKGFHASVFAGRAWREAPQLFSPVGKMLRQQNMQSSLILPGSPLIDLVILDSRTRLRRSLDANPRHGLMPLLEMPFLLPKILGLTPRGTPRGVRKSGGTALTQRF